MREDGITHAVESVGLALAVVRRRSSIRECDPVVVLSHCCIEGGCSLGRMRSNCCLQRNAGRYHAEMRQIRKQYHGIPCTLATSMGDEHT
jgi:hypothetical protein